MYNTDADCRDNPHNIRPGLAAVMAAENWILQRIPPEQKLVLVIADPHNHMSHTLFLKALLQTHAAQRRYNEARSFALGYEKPHNFVRAHENLLERTLRNFAGMEPLPDPDGLYAMAKFLDNAKNARHDLLDIFKYCCNQGISTSFNDIAWTEKGSENACIDKNDPQARDLIARWKPHLAEARKIHRYGNHPTSADGLALSNLAIVENAIKHICRSGTRLYLQQCGRNHDEGENGLSALFAARGFAVLPVALMEDSEENIVSFGAAKYYARTIRVRGLPPSEDRGLSAFKTMRLQINRESGLDL